MKLNLGPYKVTAQDGMTLIEVLVVIALLGGIVAILSQVFFAITHSNTKIELNKEAKETGEFALSAIERQIRNARTVTSVCENTGTNATSISVENPDKSISTIGCVVDGSLTRLAITTGGVINYLTSQTVTLGGATCEDSSFDMTCQSSADGPSNVAISFGLSQIGIAQSRFEEAQASFQTSVQLRNQ